MTTSTPVSATVPPPVPGSAAAAVPSSPASSAASSAGSASAAPVSGPASASALTVPGLPGGPRVVRETAGGYLLLVPQGTSPGDLPPELLSRGLSPYELLPPGGPPPDPTGSGPSGSDPSGAGPSGSGPAVSGGPPPGPVGEGVHIDRDHHTVHLDGAELALTYLEFELLAHLAEHPHRVHSREHLVSTVWGYAHHIGDGRTVDVHVARLRRKLGPRYRRRIVTIRRVGYKYTP
ncbi:winged helix-turn-helix domain-containing protein [Streptomyces axinellae]|uniref:OmpR/PhoB-type domain-containing protein n=1 Tax=Streptomyces axinellae TaxID=552788 RepID=A0ABN3QN75_9ACTN